MSSKKHHKVRHCPLTGCDYHGADLKRHLGSKKHQDEVDRGLLDALVQLADKGEKRKEEISYCLGGAPSKAVVF